LIKLLFSKELPRTERLSSVRRQRSERGIWQRRYWEHTISSESDYAQHINYIHANPLKHGHVNRVCDLPKGHKGLIPPFTVMFVTGYFQRIGVVTGLIYPICLINIKGFGSTA